MSDDLVKRVDSLMLLLNMEREKSLSLGRHIEKLEAALRKIIDRAEFKNSEYVTDIVCRIARDALEGKDG